MLFGFLCGLSAGFIWGLVYLGPLVLRDFDPVFIALCRFLVFGVFSAICVAFRYPKFQVLTRRDWIDAIALGIVGNLVFYWTLTEAVVRVGSAVAGAFTALIPVTATICANLTKREPLPWGRLVLPLTIIFAGLIMLNVDEFKRLLAMNFIEQGSDFYIGVIFALASVVLWTWYPLANAKWLRGHLRFSAMDWIFAQGITLLPTTLILLPLFANTSAMLPKVDSFFVMWMLILGVICSWVASVLWSIMSRRLPSLLVGQMIIFETISAVIYGCLWSHQMLNSLSIIGLVILLAGISLSVKICHNAHD